MTCRYNFSWPVTLYHDIYPAYSISDRWLPVTYGLSPMTSHDLSWPPMTCDLWPLFHSRFGSRAALQEAMRAVEQQYAVVGLLEDWDTSLTVMERLVPRFFGGAADIYRGELELPATQPK